jgi:imidazolonepropionase-like amidohydrolase
MRHRAPLFFLLVACSSSNTHSVAVPKPPSLFKAGDVAITNVTLVPMSPMSPMSSDGELEHQTVVVRGDRIVAVGPSASLEVPPGIKKIDGKNRWLMPGLSDMHVHTWSETDLTLFVAAGVTTVRNMFGSEQHLAWRSDIAAGKRLGPTIVTAGPIIDGDPPVWPASAALVDPADADKLVADQKAKGYDFLKPYARLSRPAYEALVAAGKRHGMALEGHVPSAVGLTGVLAAHQKSIEHLDGWLLALVPDGVSLPDDGSMQNKLRAALPRLDESRLPGLIKQTIAAGTWNCPTLVVLDRLAGLDDPDAVRRRAKWLGMVAPATVAAWDPKLDFRLRAFTAEDFATMREANVRRARILAALATAGAPILVGTDTGNPYVIPGAALHDEIELMVDAGLPRARVIRAATAGAAEFLGTPHEFGVIEVGARADLVLLSSDPLAEALPLVPDGVMARGAWFARTELEGKLSEIAAHNAASPRQDRWEGVAPLAADGVVVHEAHYDMDMAGRPFGEERLAVALEGGKRVVAAQMVAELPGRVETSYRIGPDTAMLDVKSPAGTLALSGKVAGGKLLVTGTDGKGQPVSLTQRLPAGAFLSGPGIGGSIMLAGKLTGMKVGGKRKLASLEIMYFPATAIATAKYEVERKPDADGHRVYAVTTRVGKDAATGDLVVDDQGFVVAQQLGPPMNLSFTRRPQ